MGTDSFPATGRRKKMKNQISPSEQLFIERAIGRSRLFLIMMWLGLAVGFLLLAHATYLAIFSPGGAGALRWVLAIMILLNARQNLRQHKYAEALRKLHSPTILPEDEIAQ